MKYFAYIIVCLLVISFAFGQQPKKQIKLQDTDLVSVVLTVKTSRALTAALTKKVLPTDEVAKEAIAALVRAVNGPFMPGPVPNPLLDLMK